MKYPLFIIAVLCCMLAFTGCKAAGTDTKPFDFLNQQITADDIVVRDTSLVLSSGLVVDQKVQQAASVLYSGEMIFLGIAVPLQEANAITAAAKVLDPNAVTKAALDANIAALRTDVGILHSALVGATGQIVAAAKTAQAQQAGINAQKGGGK